MCISALGMAFASSNHHAYSVAARIQARKTGEFIVNLEWVRSEPPGDVTTACILDFMPLVNMFSLGRKDIGEWDECPPNVDSGGDLNGSTTVNEAKQPWKFEFRRHRDYSAFGEAKAVILSGIRN
jgi:hypothetical protein